MTSSKPPASRNQLSLRVRKARGLDSSRIQALASMGASGGVLTPREVKEICQAIVADAEGQSVAAVPNIEPDG